MSFLLKATLKLTLCSPSPPSLADDGPDTVTSTASVSLMPRYPFLSLKFGSLLKFFIIRVSPCLDTIKLSPDSLYSISPSIYRPLSLS